MTIDLDKLQEMLQTNAHRDLVKDITGNTAIAVPQSIQVRDLQKFMPYQRRLALCFQTNEFDSFFSYVKMQRDLFSKQSSIYPVYVNAENMDALAIFDVGTIDKPLHRENRASITLRDTAEFRTVRRKDGDTFTQRGFAEFLEDWRENVTCCGSDGKALGYAASVQAVRKYEVTAKSETSSEEGNFSSRKSAMAEVAAKNEAKMPAFVDFTCIPYQGLEPRTFRFRVSVVNGNEPKFTLRVPNFEKYQEDMAAEFRDKLVAGLDQDEMHVFIGRNGRGDEM